MLIKSKSIITTIMQYRNMQYNCQWILKFTKFSFIPCYVWWRWIVPYKMVGKKHLKECVCLNSSLLMWIHQSKKIKNHSSMTLMNSMYTWSIFVMEQLFVAIQTISPMESGMIGWWFGLRLLVPKHHGKKKLGMWNGHYFPSKILCFFVLPDDDTTYAIIQSTSSSNHENDSILF